MLEMVYPLSNISILICHFPERGRSRFFYVDRYTEIVFNSLYTAKWIEKRWGLAPHMHIYPPVDMDYPEKNGKESIILSVSRFDPGGNKQQIEMIRAFEKMLKRHPERMQDWRLVLAGGSGDDNPYLDKVRRIIGQFPPGLITAAVNVSADELKSIYARAKIFWHLAGLGQSDPAKVEHFGMTIAEAMQCGCVPIVYKGGGQTEIVEDHVSGFVFEDVEALIQKTLDLVENDDLLARLRRAALERGASFRKSRFITEILEYFSRLLEGYRLDS
jgi:glycosyltransferase involved in cell wall biosynthesis